MVDMVYQLMYQVFSSFFDAQLFASTKMIHPQCKTSSWKSNIRLLAKMSGSYPCKLDGEMLLSCLGIQLQHREMCTSISSLTPLLHTITKTSSTVPPKITLFPYFQAFQISSHHTWYPSSAPNTSPHTHTHPKFTTLPR